MKASLEIPADAEAEEVMGRIEAYQAGWQDCLAHRLEKIAETGERPAAERMARLQREWAERQPAAERGFINQGNRTFFADGGIKAPSLSDPTEPPPPLPRKLSGFDEALDLMKRGFWVDWTNGDTPTGNWAYTMIPDKGENEDCVRVWERGEVSDTNQTPDEYFRGISGGVSWFEVADPTAVGMEAQS